VTGALAVARQAQIFGVRFAEFAQRAIVNGSPGTIVRVPGQPLIVAGFTVAMGRIAAIDLIADPAKLAGLGELTDRGGAD
jgi:RNA polymerase sigma-70 factor (ECF subfamily)